MTGWKCPGCGACYAPFIGECKRCQPRVTIVITPTSAQPFPPQPFPPLRPPENICRY